MKAAAYLRVSTGSQDARTQRDALERAARARGDRITRWFSEKRSGATLERAELAALRAAARRGELERLYVFRLDRLTRSGVRDTLALLDELERSGCKVLTVADGFELGGPARDVVIAVMAWAAEMERLAMAERMRAARARVERRGGTWGRPRRELDAARVLELAGAGRSVRAIAVALKVPRSTVQDTLSRVRKTPASSSPQKRRRPRARAPRVRVV